MDHLLDLLFIAHIHLAKRKLFFKREGCSEKMRRSLDPDVQNGPLTVLSLQFPALITTKKMPIRYVMLRPTESALDWILARLMWEIFFRLENSAIQLHCEVSDMLPERSKDFIPWEPWISLWNLQLIKLSDVQKFESGPYFMKTTSTKTSSCDLP